MMEQVKLKLPSQLELSGDIAVNWTKFAQRLELYFQATGEETESDKTKVAILLTVAGTEAIDLFNTWSFTAEERTTDSQNKLGDVKYSAVIKRFKDHNDDHIVDMFHSFAGRNDIKNLAKIFYFGTS